MVSAATIRKLSDDIGTLEQRLTPVKPFKAIKVHVATYSDRDAVIARHDELFPDDRDPTVMLVWTIHDANPDDEPDNGIARNGPHNLRSDVAWRDLACKEMVSMPAPAVSKLWSSRAIARALDGPANEQPFMARDVGSISARFKTPRHEALAMLSAAGIDITNDHVCEQFEIGRKDHD